MDKQHYFITTIDNPYSPFDEFVNWKRFDDVHHYGTYEKTARLCILSDNFTNEEMSYEELVASYGKLPNGCLSLAHQ